MSSIPILHTEGLPISSSMKQLINNLNDLLQRIDGLNYFSQLQQSEGAEWYEADQDYVQKLGQWAGCVESILKLTGQGEYLETWQKATGSEITVGNVSDYADTLRILLKQCISTLEQKYDHVPDLAKVVDTPFLSTSDISGAYKMAELYIVLHCYENSVRQFIEATLLRILGENWWDQVANTGMKERLKTRKEKEQRQSWLSPRGGASPLYYLDWGDLVTLIRKREDDFLPYLGDMRFVDNRFEELEGLRNIIAHGGVLPSEDDFQRVIISFRDWCCQIGQFYSQTAQI